MNIIDRFWKHVDKKSNDECWNWTASLRGEYGSFNINGKTLSAHRVIYELINGNIPNKLNNKRVCVLHKCDNPLCVNPSHLFLGTDYDNVIDKVKKGRDYNGLRMGESNPNSKLSKEDIVNIRLLYFKKEKNQRQLSIMYHVSTTQIWKIIHNIQWNK